MLESRPEDALVKLANTVESVEIVETDETVETGDLKKHDFITYWQLASASKNDPATEVAE